MKRRTLLSMAAAGALAAVTPAWAAKPPKKAEKPLKILILGGTRFIGLHMTALALARGHTLTFFNRGKTKTDRYPEVERIKGDRNGEIDGLKDREWDVVIDNSGYVPRHVRLSAELLAPRVTQYVFVSSISVYPDFSVPRDEKSPVGKLADESIEKVDGDTYGPLKALCEQAAEKALPGRTTIMRPGLIVGPDDNTDRFTYWPARAARGGEFIAPGAPGDPFQIIDVRDLAAFTLNAIENKDHRHLQPRDRRQRLQVRRAHRRLHRRGQEPRRSPPLRRARPIYPRSSSRNRRSSRGARCPCGCRPRATKPRSPAPAPRPRPPRASRSLHSRRP